MLTNRDVVLGDTNVIHLNLRSNNLDVMYQHKYITCWMVNKIFGVKQNILPHKLHLTGSENVSREEEKKKSKRIQGKEKSLLFL